MRYADADFMLLRVDTLLPTPCDAAPCAMPWFIALRFFPLYCFSQESAVAKL